MKAVLMLFLFALLGLCFWKILEPNKSVADILKEIKDVFVDHTYNTDNTDQLSAMPMYPGFHPLYECNRVKYENMAVSVRDCMDKFAYKLRLSIPEDPTKIYSSEIADRVQSIDGNQIMFVYEVYREPVFQGRKVLKVADSEIQTALCNNLPGYLWGGLCYTGPICAKDVGSGRIRIQISGVKLYYGGY